MKRKERQETDAMETESANGIASKDFTITGLEIDFADEVGAAVEYEQKVEMARRLVRWAVEKIPNENLVMSTSFGIQSAVLLHLVSQIRQDTPVIWIDTGYLPPETYRYAAELKQAFNLNIKIYQSELSCAHMEAMHGKLWESENPADHRLYGLLRKVLPMKKAQAELSAKCMMVGLRRSQTDHRKNLDVLEKPLVEGCCKLYPILNWTDSDVIRYFTEMSLPKHPLEAKGYTTVGDAHSSRPRQSTDRSDRDSRFGKSSQQECGLHTETGSLQEYHGYVQSITNKATQPASADLTTKNAETDESSGVEGSFSGYEVYSQPACKYCEAAKFLLMKNKLQFVSFFVRKPSDNAVPAEDEKAVDLIQVIRRVRTVTGNEDAPVNTIPQILCNGQYIGGFAELCASLDVPTAEADKILAQFTAPAQPKKEAVVADLPVRSDLQCVNDSGMFDPPEVYEVSKEECERLRQLLSEGCDDRIVLNPKTGMHMYNGTTQPVARSIRRSSTTFNCPTGETFKAGLKVMAEVEEANGDCTELRRSVMSRLREVWKLPEGSALTLFPSGTDAEFLPLLIALAQARQNGGNGRVATIVNAAGEVGSGTENAAKGCFISSMIPALPTTSPNTLTVGNSIFHYKDQVQVDAIKVKLRLADGKRRTLGQLDAEVTSAVEKALNEDNYSAVVVHLVAGSKTGHLMPSFECLNALLDQYGTAVVPVVDACQTRMADGGLKSLVEAGFTVLTTGSKFYGGPPFCGAALLPVDTVAMLEEALNPETGVLHDIVQRSYLKYYIGPTCVADELPSLQKLVTEDAPNLSLLIRWEMSLVNIEQYHAIPPDQRNMFMRAWTGCVVEMLEEKHRKWSPPLVSILDDRSQKDTQFWLEDNKYVNQQRTLGGLNPMQTILCLDLKKLGSQNEPLALSLDEMKKLQYLMTQDLSNVQGVNLTDDEAQFMSTRMFIGQPVTLGDSLHVLRVAIDVPLMLRWYRTAMMQPQEAENSPLDIQEEDAFIMEKMQFLLSHWTVYSKA